MDGKKGESYIDEKGRIVIVINTEAEGIGNKDVLAGVLVEELSHGINYADGKDKGAGTETLAGHSNDYFAGKVGDSNSSLSLTGDGKDYNGVDFGEHVGDKIVLNDPIINESRESDSYRKAFISTQIEAMYGSGKITENEKKELMKELDKLSKYNIITADGEKYFLDFYGKDNVDTITTSIDSTGRKVITYKEGDLSGVDQYTKDKTLMVRKIIDSEISVFLQIPSKEQISKIGGKDENDKNKTNIEAGNYITYENEKPIVLYYKPNEEVSYIYGIEKLDMKKPMDTEFNKTIMDEYSRATHEIMVHPSDFIDLKTNGKIALTNETRVVNRNDGEQSNPFSRIVYIEGSEQKVKTKEGQEMYFLPGVFEHEVNTAIFEERTRDRTNPTGQGNVNVKFIYSDSSEILKYAQLFRSKEEIKVFFDKFGE